MKPPHDPTNGTIEQYACPHRIGEHERHRDPGLHSNFIDGSREILDFDGLRVIIDAGDLNRAAIEVSLVFGGISEGIDSPAGVGIVRIEVVDANMLRWNRWVCSVGARREGEDAGEDEEEAHRAGVGEAEDGVHWRSP